MHDGQVRTEAAVVAEAVAAQFPHLAAIEVVAVLSAGIVIAPFRVGPTLLARVPVVPVASRAAAARVEAEGRYARLLRERVRSRCPAS